MSTPLTVLCVDDERMVLVALREQLQRHFGDEILIETADDGESALELFREVLEDGVVVPLVITDQIMPGLKGDELVALVYECSPQTRNVMLTGQASASAVGNALNTGGLYRFISKPWDQEDLVMTVREALRSHTRELELADERAALREVHGAALELTASLAASDRYARLLERLVPILGADHGALLRRHGDRWLPIAVTGMPREHPTDPPEEARQRWARDAYSEQPVRGCAGDAAKWLWDIDDCRTAVNVPLRIHDDVVGLLTVSSSRAGAFDGIGDERFLGAGSLAAAALHTAALVDALEESNERRQRVAQELVRQANAAVTGVLLGQSTLAMALRAGISRIADVDPSRRILLTGPPGSEREGVARAIHAESPRAERPFIPVNCAFIRTTEELSSKLELARGATIFLHGIEHLDEEANRALRSALDGPGAAELDVRLIATVSASLSLAPEIEEWHSDEHLVVPALAERAEDVGAMAALYLSTNASRFGRADLTLSEASLARLEAYAWPGNVRELMGVLERAALMATSSVVEVDEALLEIGESVGSYTLIEVIGAGGMGDVWRARHKHLARPAAVKLIQNHSGTGFEPAAIQRFRREAEATARLRSPNTVEVYDFGVTESGGLFYVMELLEGMDLQSLVRRCGALPPERVVHILDQVLRSLMEAHESGLVHRDIKPANLYVCCLGSDCDFVKVLDFGLVTVMDEQVEITQRGVVVGTPGYMSPEHGAETDLDGRADLYSLGAVAFWMLTGEKLFKASSPTALILAHLSETPDAPSDRLGAPLPAGLDAWVLSMLAKSPDERPATARDAHRALMAIPLPDPWTRERSAAWWESQPTVAPPPSPEESVGSAPTRDEKPRTR